MKPLMAALIGVSLAANAGAALANNDKSHGKGNGHGQAVRVQPAPLVQAAGCPPGLAKKSPACVPPGQAKKAYPRYGVGDYIDGDYRFIRDPGRYHLDRRNDYVVMNDYVYRIDPETRKILNLIGALTDLVQ
ncbi:hypothetical protein [Tropicimonas isoalkanivorans]|uniref:Regulator RcnB of Ni and Co efflux n=1 Tax=Tropicimonas isoalkanivorans TaxID=441112 RepID=A0A1I1E7D7_9RHOB|nr:hypothetical protein [Tropicimonas isoalkanivorans]SFB81228.1 hypothetical protein SAMN04488094_101595 [Tropicimonas isoalkanivorans]